MLCGRLLGLTISLCLLGFAVSAGEREPSSEARAAHPGQQADNASGPASPPQADSAAAPTSSPAASDPPAPQPVAPVGFATEFATRLAAEGRLSAADKADRAALLQFYQARQNEPVWISPTGLTPAAGATVAELSRADDWGLDASAFRTPAL